jgi:hypothetical protein
LLIVGLFHFGTAQYTSRRRWISTRRSQEISCFSPFRAAMHGPNGYNSMRVASIFVAFPDALMYSTRTVRSSHDEGTSVFGPLLLGNNGLPLLSGFTIAASYCELLTGILSLHWP